MRKYNVKDAKLSSVDLCKQGANPFADIALFKSMDKEGGEKGMDLMTKFAKAFAEAFGLTKQEETTNVYKEISDGTTSLHKSFMSIAEAEMSKEEREEMFKKSLEEFCNYCEGAIEKWSEGGGKAAEDGDVLEVDPEDDDEEYEEDEETMEKMNIEKMSKEDREAYEALKKKYGTDAENGAGVGAGSGDPAENEALKKALEEVATLTKNIEMNDIKKSCEKYEILGKDANETAEMLYNLKKANPDAYDQVVKAFDEAAELAGKSDIFKEHGSSRTGGNADLKAAVEEVKKSHPELSHHEAIVKAYELNPNLNEY